MIFYGRLALAFGIAGALSFLSCKKEYQSRYCDTPPQVECGFDSTKVNVRIWNKTGYPICNVRLKYQTNTPDTLRYGTMDVEELSCYIELSFSKVFPRVRFELGTGHFSIPDSLTTDTLPYNSLRETNPGFYTYFIQMGGPLENLDILTFMTRDNI